MGWTTLASTVNLVAGTQLLGARRGSVPSQVAAISAAAASSSLITALILRSRQGIIPLATASIWGLATTTANSTRPAPIRIATALASLAITAAIVPDLRKNRAQPDKP